VFAYDEVPAGSTFRLHRHENAEIVSIVLEGSYDHEDTAGHRGRVSAGEVGLMQAGSGVEHSEAGNPDVQTRSVTIWLRPRTMNKPPTHMTARPIEQNDRWQLIAAEHDAPLIVEQDARILMRRLAPHEQTPVTARPGRLVYLAVVEGEAVADGQRLSVPERILLRHGEIGIASNAGATVVVVDVALAN
jgi:redox-sensitive bicupin YhaK (pirin superfamily)